MAMSTFIKNKYRDLYLDLDSPNIVQNNKGHTGKYYTEKGIFFLYKKTECFQIGETFRLLSHIILGRVRTGSDCHRDKNLCYGS